MYLRIDKGNVFDDAVKFDVAEQSAFLRLDITDNMPPSVEHAVPSALRAPGRFRSSRMDTAVYIAGVNAKRLLLKVKIGIQDKIPVA